MVLFERVGLSTHPIIHCFVSGFISNPDYASVAFRRFHLGCGLTPLSPIGVALRYAPEMTLKSAKNLILGYSNVSTC